MTDQIQSPQAPNDKRAEIERRIGEFFTARYPVAGQEKARSMIEELFNGQNKDLVEIAQSNDGVLRLLCLAAEGNEGSLRNIYSKDGKNQKTINGQEKEWAIYGKIAGYDFAGFILFAGQQKYQVPKMSEDEAKKFNGQLRHAFAKFALSDLRLNNSGIMVGKDDIQRNIFEKLAGSKDVGDRWYKAFQDYVKEYPGVITEVPSKDGSTGGLYKFAHPRIANALASEALQNEISDPAPKKAEKPAPNWWSYITSMPNKAIMWMATSTAWLLAGMPTDKDLQLQEMAKSATRPAMKEVFRLTIGRLCNHTIYEAKINAEKLIGHMETLANSKEYRDSKLADRKKTLNDTINACKEEAVKHGVSITSRGITR